MQSETAISRELMGKIVDEVFDGAIEDASVIEEIYAVIKREEAALSAAEPVEQEKNPMRFFADNVDNWGALEWFNRLVDACEDHDRKRTLAFRCTDSDEKDMLSLSADTSKMNMSSSAFRLARDHADEIRKALTPQPVLASTEGEELKPCPFCGGKPEFRRSGRQSHYIACTGCDSASTLFTAAKDDVRELLIETWNRRAFCTQVFGFDIGAGWQLVPKEADRKMIEAGLKTTGMPANTYRDMLAAARGEAIDEDAHL